MLHIAQPALTHHLKRMEADFGQRLLVREPRGVTPTREGETLFRHAVAVLRHAANLHAAMRSDRREPSGAVAVGLARTLADWLALALYERVRREHPAVQLELQDGHSADLGRAIAEARLDLAMLMPPAPAHGSVDLPLMTEELVVAGPVRAPWWPQARTLSLQRMSTLPLLMSSRRDRLHALLAALTAEKKIGLDTRGHIDSPGALLDAVEAGHGAAVLPWCAVQDRVARRRLSTKRLAGSRLERQLLLCRPQSVPLSPAAAAVAHSLVALCRERVADRSWRGARWIDADRGRFFEDEREGSGRTAPSPL